MADQPMNSQQDPLFQTLLKKASSIGPPQLPTNMPMMRGEMPGPKLGKEWIDFILSQGGGKLSIPLSHDVMVGKGIQNLMEKHGPDWAKMLVQGMSKVSSPAK